MRKFTIVWTEQRSMDIEAQSKEEAREKFLSGEVDYSFSDCHQSLIDDIYEVKE